MKQIKRNQLSRFSLHSQFLFGTPFYVSSAAADLQGPSFSSVPCCQYHADTGYVALLQVILQPGHAMGGTKKAVEAYHCSRNIPQTTFNWSWVPPNQVANMTILQYEGVKFFFFLGGGFKVIMEITLTVSLDQTISCFLDEQLDYFKYKQLYDATQHK